MHNNEYLIIEELPRISLKQLKEDGLFVGQSPISFTSKGMKISVDLLGEDDPDDCRIYITWQNKGGVIEQYIQLTPKETNLGLGYYRWFFTTQDTEALFLKAYFSGKQFVHRVELKRAYYKQQLHTRFERVLYNNLVKPINTMEEFEQSRPGKYFKMTYRGEPTKRMKKLDELYSQITTGEKDKASLLKPIYVK